MPISQNCSGGSQDGGNHWGMSPGVNLHSVEFRAVVA
jgi:hypothetical protein